MKVVHKLKENWFSYGLIAFNFFVSYMGTFYLAHNLFEVNKFIEAIIIGTIPILSSVILSAIICNNKGKVREYFHWAIMPTLIAEKITIPLYEYLDAKIHGSLELNFGIPSESEFIIYLLQGKIG